MSAISTSPLVTISRLVHHPCYAKLAIVVEFKRLIQYSEGLPKIAVPSFAAVLARAHRLLSGRKTVVVARIILLVVVGYLVIDVLIGQLNTAKNSEQASYTTKSYESPTYQTVLPNGKSANAFGGWRRVSPPEGSPVFAYADVIDGVSVSVSEQPLPASFTSDPGDQVASLAEKFNATDKIDAGTSVIYVGTSAKGPQSAIMTRDNLLILIKSQKKISDTAWSAYAASLR